MSILWPWPPWHQFRAVSIAYLGLLDLPLTDFLTIPHFWMEATVKSACFHLCTRLSSGLGCAANSLVLWDPNQAPPPLGRPSDPHPTSFHSRYAPASSPGGLGWCCPLCLQLSCPSRPWGQKLCLTHLCTSSAEMWQPLHQTGWTRTLSLWPLQGTGRV